MEIWRPKLEGMTVIIPGGANNMFRAQRQGPYFPKIGEILESLDFRFSIGEVLKERFLFSASNIR